MRRGFFFKVIDEELVFKVSGRVSIDIFAVSVVMCFACLIQQLIEGINQN